MYRCEELLLCQPPPIGAVLGTSETVCRVRTAVPLLLVRDDGVIYRTGRTFTYEVDPVAVYLALHHKAPL
jgi:hypothetical protein